MTKRKVSDFRNGYRSEWCESVGAWLDKNTSERINEKPVCPRCGVHVDVESNATCYSQYYSDMVICGNCAYDEILRDSVGQEQADISTWYINTKQQMSYVLN